MKARGIKTNGKNMPTVSHLNLTRTMADVIEAEHALYERQSTMSHTRRYERQWDYKIPYAGKESS